MNGFEIFVLFMAVWLVSNIASFFGESARNIRSIRKERERKEQAARAAQRIGSTGRY